VIVALLAIGVYAIASGLNPSPTPLAAGKVAPNFTLTATDGKQYSLNDYRGKVVLLEFFAPWCPHCRNEVAVLNQVAKTYAGQDVQVLSVTDTPYGYNYESSGDTSPITMTDVTRFVNTYHVSYPAMLDTSLKAGNAYGVAAFPQIYVIDRNGTIAWNNGGGGETAYKDLQTAIQRAQAVPLQTATSTAPAVSASATPAK
jgi:peroxiredoxin